MAAADAMRKIGGRQRSVPDVPPVGPPDGGVGLDPPSPPLPSLGVGALLGARLDAEGAGTGSDGGVGLDPPSPPLPVPSLGVGASPGAWLDAEGDGTGGGPSSPPHVRSQPVVTKPIPHASACRISLAHTWQPHSPPSDIAEHITSLISLQVGTGRVALLKSAS